LSQRRFIPVCEPLLDGRELEYASDAISTGWISGAGAYIDRFEAAFAEYCDVPHAIGVSNGTAALQVAVRALDLPPESEVILPSFTIVSCAIAVVDSGLIPVFVDVEEDTWNVSASTIEQAIGPKTRAIMIVHMYGHPVDVDPIRELIGDRPIAIIEDAAQAHGARYRGRKCGGRGDISTFSFFANKLVTTGEGGMVTTSDDHLAARARSLRNLCFKPESRFVHDELGWNFRLSNLHAAVGLAQLENADKHLQHKRQLAGWYSQRLATIDGLTLPVQHDHAESGYWMYGIVLDPALGKSAVAVSKALLDEGIQTRPFFQSLHRQPPFEDYRARWSGRSFEVTDRIAEYGLYLPTSASLDEATADFIAETLKAVLAG